MSSDTKCLLGAGLGFIAACVAVRFIYRGSRKNNVSDGGAMFLSMIGFLAVWLFFIFTFAPPKDPYTWDGYHELKQDEDYDGQKMLEASQNGNTASGEDWADKYTAAKQKADDYYEHLSKQEELKNSSTNK